MVSTAIAYTILTIALVGLLGFTVVVGGLLQTAQNIPATYIELGNIAYSIEEQMVSAYKAALNTHSTIYSSIYAPSNIYGVKYTLNVIGGTVIKATCGTVQRTISLPNLSGVTWAGQFKSGGALVHIVAFYVSDTITVTISD